MGEYDLMTIAWDCKSGVLPVALLVDTLPEPKEVIFNLYILLLAYLHNTE